MYTLLHAHVRDGDAHDGTLHRDGGAHDDTLLHAHDDALDDTPHRDGDALDDDHGIHMYTLLHAHVHDGDARVRGGDACAHTPTPPSYP